MLAREALLRKYLRQPIYNWIDEPEFHVVHDHPDERYKEQANKEFALCAEVVIRSRSPAYAKEMLEHAKRHNVNDELLLRKLTKLAEKT